MSVCEVDSFTVLIAGYLELVSPSMVLHKRVLTCATCIWLQAVACSTARDAVLLLLLLLLLLLR
jgi:hypothetical protein